MKRRYYRVEKWRGWCWAIDDDMGEAKKVMCHWTWNTKRELFRHGSPGPDAVATRVEISIVKRKPAKKRKARAGGGS